MKIKETELKGVYLISPKVIEDSRGYFYEKFRSDYFSQNSIPTIFAQAVSYTHLTLPTKA